MKRLRHIFAACTMGLAVPAYAATQDMRATDPAFRDAAMERAKLLVVPYEEGSTPWQEVATAKDLMGDTRSGFDAALFRNGDKYAFAFYGYNEAADLNEVVKIGFLGVPRHQLREARDFVTRAGEVYGFDPASAEFVGHSMGGYIAKAVGPHTGAEDIWAFNSPGFKWRDPHRIDKLFRDKATTPAPPVYNIDARNDIVAEWGHQSGQVYTLDAGPRHHAIASMVTSLRNMDPLAKGDKPLQAEARVERKPLGFIARAFNRVTQSNFVQKRIVARFKDRSGDTGQMPAPTPKPFQ